MKEKVIEWVKNQASEKNKQIDMDTDLFDLGILDSFGIIGLIAYMIEELGIEIDPESLSGDNFQTLNEICKLIK